METLVKREQRWKSSLCGNILTDLMPGQAEGGSGNGESICNQGVAKSELESCR